MTVAKLFLDGAWAEGASVGTIEEKYTGDALAEVHQASPEQVAQAVGALKAGQAAHVIPPYERFEILSRAVALLDERREDVITTIVGESGFTRTDATTEVTRALQTLRLSAEEAPRLTGHVVPMEGAPGITRRVGYTTRHPVGVVCAITPFNSPLNTVSHKVGPAIAAGNAVLLKPASATPLTSMKLVEILLEAGLPETHVALIHGPARTVGNALLEDPRLNYYAFTGSTEVGRHIRATVGLRPSQLELGSLSSTILCDDADLEDAVAKCVNGAFRKAGQVCTSIQRIYVHDQLHDRFLDRVVEEVGARQVGDPYQAETFVGPLISAPEAERVEQWVASAVSAGAKALAGGERDERVVAPTVLVDVAPDMQVMCEEVFGPVVSVKGFSDFDAAVDEVNDTPYGLAAGVFTQDVSRALRAADRLHMGSVHINETSSSRVDLMPYGGAKDSGLGQEGPRYAAREMTEERLVTIKYY